jgi:hypothetical protein
MAELLILWILREVYLLSSHSPLAYAVYQPQLSAGLSSHEALHCNPPSLWADYVDRCPAPRQVVVTCDERTRCPVLQQSMPALPTH